MGDRYNIFSQMEHLQSKYVGTGHADTTKWEWVVNAHRDTYARFTNNIFFPSICFPKQLWDGFNDLIKIKLSQFMRKMICIFFVATSGIQISCLTSQSLKMRRAPVSSSTCSRKCSTHVARLHKSRNGWTCKLLFTALKEKNHTRKKR